MKKIVFLTVSLVVVFAIAGCANIEHKSVANQKIGNTRIAGIGDVVLSIDRFRNLENALGKSDIFGRKTKEGYTEIRFAGLEPDGTIVFYRKDVSIISNETTMSRTPISLKRSRSDTVVNATGATRGNQTDIEARGSTNYTSTTINQSEDYHIAVPSDSIAIRLNHSDTVLPISGYIINIESSSDVALKYKIVKQQ